MTVVLLFVVYFAFIVFPMSNIFFNCLCVSFFQGRQQTETLVFPTFCGRSDRIDNVLLWIHPTYSEAGQGMSVELALLPNPAPWTNVTTIDCCNEREKKTKNLPSAFARVQPVKLHTTLPTKTLKTKKKNNFKNISSASCTHHFGGKRGTTLVLIHLSLLPLYLSLSLSLSLLFFFPRVWYLKNSWNF